MSRYLERAEHTARLVDVNLNLTLDQPPSEVGPRWVRLQACLIPAPAEAGGSDPSGAARAIAFDLMLRPTLATCLAAGREDARAILVCLAAARENARHVRERVSSEMWEQINRLYLETRGANLDALWDHQPHAFFRGVQEGAHLFHGITDGTMCHDEGWHFVQLGRFIERAAATAALLDVHCGAVLAPERRADREQYLEWVGLLKCCTAFEAFCKVHSADPRPEFVLQFLMLDAEFPHALHYAIATVESSLRAIAAQTGRRPTPADRLAGRLLSALRFQTIDEILASGLHPFLCDVQNQCAHIQDSIHHSYVEQHLSTAPVA
jgi:uncharacterized alpha-E superfamily protein